MQRTASRRGLRWRPLLLDLVPILSFPEKRRIAFLFLSAAATTADRLVSFSARTLIAQWPNNETWNWKCVCVCVCVWKQIKNRTFLVFVCLPRGAGIGFIELASNLLAKKKGQHRKRASKFVSIQIPWKSTHDNSIPLGKTR